MARIAPISPETLEEAAALLRAGELIAFPTETVYGLGADATHDAAVARIFEAKDRPRFNPLIVHVADTATARSLAVFDDRADLLAARFWPGPLSLVLPRAAGCKLSRLVSAGLETVALRVPAREDARLLLRQAGVPVAAPSANRSGRLSPTEAKHVAAELGDRVALILDGGPCAVGLESTVVDLSGEAPALLRAGGAVAEEIESELGESLVDPMADPMGDGATRSPGMLEVHYAPSIPLRMDAISAAAGEALLGFGPAPDAALNLSEKGDLVEAAANLFRHLHALDGGEFAGIAVMRIPNEGLGRAINDRLRRAAANG